MQRGRAFAESDRQEAPPVAVVNETFARRFFPDTDALGKRFTLDKKAIEIVGIARDGKYETLGEEPTPYFYLPFAQSYMASMTLHVRAARTNGLTPEEISEVLLHTAVYAGVPAANAAFAIAQRVLGDESS